jgi:hypothetical protein
VTNVDGIHDLTGISCPSTSLCVAVDAAGDAVTSTSPAGGPSEWTATNMDESHALHAVSCSSSFLCVATDDYGRVVSSTNPTSGALAWTATSVYANALFGVSCAGSDLCVALSGGTVLPSKHPSAAEESAWPIINADSAGRLQGISCPSSRFCVAVDQAGNALISTDEGTSWSATQIDGANNAGFGLDAVSCPSIDLCVAVDTNGNVLTGVRDNSDVTSAT